MAVKGKNTKKVPNLRFPGFTDAWQEHTLGEIAEFSKGRGISKNDIDKNGKLECIRYGELYTHYTEVISEIRSRTNIKEESLTLSKANDVIIPASGETQIDIATASCVLKDGVALGGDLNIIRTSHNGVFLSYYLNSKKKNEIANLAQGISVVHLYSSQLATLKVNLPSLAEQKKIASYLSILDNRIKTQNKIIQQLESLIKGIRALMFSAKIRFKDLKGRDFPNWKKSKLDEVSQVIMGQSPDSKSYNSEGKGIPLIQGNTDIFNRTTKPRNYTTSITKQCEIGDLILTVRAPVGSVAKSAHNACIGRGVCALRINKSNNPEFFYQFLIHYEPQWASLEQGSTFTAVNSSEVRNIEVIRPCLDEQNIIAKFLSTMESKKQTEVQILEGFESQKKFLLENFFI